MGTPELARTVLGALADDSRWEVVGVVVQPDKPVGRGLQLQAPPVKVEALARGLRVLQPGKARDPGFLEELAGLAPDVVVVAAYGQLLPPALLAIPRRGCLNVHTSLLPRWRGAAPIQWAIAEGDAETGVTLMRMDAGLDTGDVVAEARTPILDTDNGQTLHDRLGRMGAELLVRTLPDWLEGRVEARPQPVEGVTYARKLTREMAGLDWGQPAVVLDRRIRAFHPWPGAHTSGPGGLLKIWEAAPDVESSGGEPGEVRVASGDDLLVATSRGGLRLRVVQREGRRRMTAREFLTGGGLKPGDRLGAA
jgi:methionyl-tRNA formyltransferase